MKKFYLPNYKDGSILNLMSSIGDSFGWKSRYKPLKILSPNGLKDSKNIVLIVVDGLGYEYLVKEGKNSILYNNLRGKMTSVFPTATTAAIPSLITGNAPIEHEMVSWFSFLKEFGCVTIPLMYKTRIKKPRINLEKIEKIDNIFNLNPLSSKINVNPYIITKEENVDSEFSKASGGNAKRIGYKNISKYFLEIK